MEKLFFFLSLFLAAAGTAAAEERQYIFRSVDVDDGLSQNSVMDIIQDRTGFVWFGTKDGLNRYDGDEIRRFSPDNAIPGNEFVTSMCEDAEGRIWVGTTAGMCIYYPEYEKEERFLKKTASGKYIDRGVNGIVRTPDGDIWCAVNGCGFFRYCPGSDVLTQAKCSADGSVNYSDARNIAVNSRGWCYVDVGDGNIYVSEDGLATVKPLFSTAAPPPFLGIRINCLSVAPYSKLFVCTVQGLYCINLAAGELQKVDLGWDRFNHVHDIAVMADGEIWVGSDTGIVILDKDMKVIHYMLPEWGDANSPDDIATYSFCLDREGGMWAGTYFGGAGYYPKDHTHIRRYYPTSYSEHFGQRVREIVPSPDGTLWVGTEDRGLVHFFPETGTYAEIRHPAISDNIHGLCLDGNSLWIGTYDRYKGLVRYDVKTGGVRGYPDAGLEIYSILRTAAGNIVIGTTSGMAVYDRKHDRFVRDTSMTCFIRDIEEDSSGNLWVATDSEGVYVRDALTLSWKHFTYDEDDPTSLASNMALGIFEDSRSRIWITTQGGGICRHIPETGTFKRYLSENIIPYTTVYRIEEDAKGVFWLTTNNGLVRYDETEGKVAVYTTADGLLCNQFNYSSSCMAADGRLWAGCIKGLMSFLPSAFKEDPEAYPIVFTGLSIYNRTAGIGSPGSPLDRSITLLDRINLSSDQSTFSIKVSSLNFRSPGHGSLQYMLEGYDSEWYPVRDNTISYTRLSSGTYTLRVIDEDGGVSERKLVIHVRPPLYLTVWAFAFYTLCLVAAGAYAVFHFKKRQNEAREKMEQDKIRELYVAKFNFFTNIAHEIRTPLSLITAPLESLKKNMPATGSPEIEEDIDMISRNTGRLTELINQLLDFRKAEQGGFTLNMSECSIPSLLKDTYAKFASAARLRNIKMTLSLPEEDFKTVADSEAIVKIVSNLLSNALKYARSYADLSLELDMDAREFRIILVNDGKVIPGEMRNSIFQPFVQYGDAGSTMAGTGIGLALARSLAELHHGCLCMDTDESVNRFICTVPLVYPESSGLGVLPRADSSEVSAVHGNVRMPERYSVLIVEDNPEMLAFLERQFSGSYNVRTAADGMEARRILSETDWQTDIVVSDVMMPQMDGFALCRWIKDNLYTSHIPVILLTAKTDVGSKISGLGFGADSYIEKPFSVAYLQASVKSILENRERMRRHFSESPLSKVSSLAASKADEKFLSTLKEFIMENISDPDLSVNDMADAVCMSQSNLFRKLKGAINMAPVEYLQIERLKKAAELLLEYKYTVAEVSLMTGFNSNTYFTLCFKKQFGMTPSAFMKNNRKKTI